MPGKKKSKKPKSAREESASPREPEDPIAANVRVPPPPRPGESLRALLLNRQVDEKELLGMKISSRVLEQLTPQEIRELKMVFDVFDTNSSGTVDAQKLRRAFRVLGFKMSKEDVREMMFNVTKKAKGEIDFNEFLEMVIERQGDSRDIYEEIKQGFKMMDYDDTGKITVGNLKQACKDAGIRFTDREIHEMVEEADVNGDNAVDEEEFINIMLKTNLF
ncbi:uncharacterized protein [Branchiostoma lanceolatum]|uniref:uncharacterized protein n=1 Tax=Branchiostoma lanceolatum TaxID=7740 RepID=UPI0034560D8E